MGNKFNLFPNRLRDWQKEAFEKDLESCNWVVPGTVRLVRVNNKWTGEFTSTNGERMEAFPAKCNHCGSVVAHFGDDASAECSCGNFDICPAAG